MILRFFRSSEPFALFFLPLMAVLLNVPRFLQATPVEHTVQGPLYEVLIPWLQVHPVLDLSSGILFSFLGAMVFTRMLNAHEFMERNTNLSGLIYITLSAGIWALQGTQAIVIANLFLLLAIGRLWQVYRQPVVYREVFDAGLLLGLAAMFYAPLTGLLPFFWLGLSVLRPFKWREWVLLLLGLIVPVTYALVWYLWNGDNLSFAWLVPSWKFQISAVYNAMYGGLELLSFTVFGILLLLSVGSMTMRMSVSVKRVRNLKQVIFSISVGLLGIYTVTLFGYPSFSRIGSLVIPMSFMLTLFFWRTRNWVAELSFIFMVAVFLLKSVIYSGLVAV